MNTLNRMPGVGLSSLALLLTLAGCDRTDNDGVEARPAVRKAVEATGTADAKAAAATDKAIVAADRTAAQVADQLHPDDALIAAKVTTGLAADKNLSALRIKVDVRGGVVTLRGPAPTVAARARAEEIARNVQGVTSVNNQLSVQAG